jgi:hypothetical protein
MKIFLKITGTTTSQNSNLSSWITLYIGDHFHRAELLFVIQYSVTLWRNSYILCNPNTHCQARLEVLTAVLKIYMFWDVTSCRLTKSPRLIDPEYQGTVIPGNVGKYLPLYVARHTRGPAYQFITLLTACITCFYPEPDKFSPHPHSYIFHFHFNIILYCYILLLLLLLLRICCMEFNYFYWCKQAWAHSKEVCSSML